jgi:hypothetical protein
MRRPSRALVLSSAALFVALGGPAAAQQAAQAIPGARLVGNSVTGAKIATAVSLPRTSRRGRDARSRRPPTAP